MRHLVSFSFPSRARGFSVLIRHFFDRSCASGYWHDAETESCIPVEYWRSLGESEMIKDSSLVVWVFVSLGSGLSVYIFLVILLFCVNSSLSCSILPLSREQQRAFDSARFASRNLLEYRRISTRVPSARPIRPGLAMSLSDILWDLIWEQRRACEGFEGDCEGNLRDGLLPSLPLTLPRSLWEQIYLSTSFSLPDPDSNLLDRRSPRLLWSSSIGSSSRYPPRPPGTQESATECKDTPGLYESGFCCYQVSPSCFCILSTSSFKVLPHSFCNLRKLTLVAHYRWSRISAIPSLPFSRSRASIAFDMSLSSLPTELLRQIIESSVPSTYHTTTYRKRQSTLCALCLVSRRFRLIAQPILRQIVSCRWSSGGALLKQIEEVQQWSMAVCQATIPLSTHGDLLELAVSSYSKVQELTVNAYPLKDDFCLLSHLSGTLYSPLL